MTENRVKVKNYGRLKSTDPRLIAIPSVPGKICKLHHLAAAAFTVMAAACFMATGIRLTASSAWRPHKWTSRKNYEDYLVAKYAGYKEVVKATRDMSPEDTRAYIIEFGDNWIAYDSPHETGLAVDLKCGGLVADSLTAPQQKHTTLYKWLTDNAAIYSWTPYLKEPWHWEFNIPKSDWEKSA